MKKGDIKIIECPRDAMQGIPKFIPTKVKAAYINCLLQVGYDTIDFGSFVSPRAVPQMKDTAKVLSALDLSQTDSKLLAIVANERGALQASQFEKIAFLGFPFSVSETFQMRNTNSTIAESLDRVKGIRDICEKHGKELVVYISMGFGNPYGDPYSTDVVEHWTGKLIEIGTRILSLSDTVGVANPETIRYLFKRLIPAFPQAEFGAHLHTAPHNWRDKIESAYMNGCRRFDSAIQGFGGCPMAQDDLIGNMPTEHLINYFKTSDIKGNFDLDAFEMALRKARTVFPAQP